MTEEVFDRDEWMRRTGPLYPALVAVWMVTRVPMPGSFAPDTDDLGRAAPWFPLVGALLGAIIAMVGAVLLGTGLVAALVAAVVVALIILSRGGLGEVAATRVSERLGGQDPAFHGGDGVTMVGLLALAVVVGLRGMALVGVDTGSWVGALIVSQAVAHWVPLLLLKLGDPLEVPWPRRSSFVAGDFGWAAFGAATGGTALVGLLLGGAVGLLGLLLAAAAAFGIGLLLQRTFGGLTDDGLATVSVACELVVLLCFAAGEPAASSPWVGGG